MLARAPLAGGAPRDIREGGHVEFPIGNPIEGSAGSAAVNPGGATIRVAPSGELAALTVGDAVQVVDQTGKRRTLSPDWNSIKGLAWSASGAEVLFAAAKRSAERARYAVDLAGRERLLTRSPGSVTLHDVSRDGQVLLTQDRSRSAMSVRGPGDDRERDLSWFDASLLKDISADGGTLLFAETREEGSAESVYLRKSDGSPAVRLGEGSPLALSPDGRWVLAVVGAPAPHLALLPTGAGTPKTLVSGSFRYQGGGWFAGGRRIVFAGAEGRGGMRLYSLDLEGGGPVPISREGVMHEVRGNRWDPVSPDGRWVIGFAPDRGFLLCPIDGGEPRPIPGLAARDWPIRFSRDGRSILVRERGELPHPKVHRVQLDSGRRQVWGQLSPSDLAGVTAFPNMQITPDERWYAYTYNQVLSQLYLVNGLK